MRKVVLLITILAVVAFVGSAMATAPGKTVEYDGGPLGKVTFDGTTHKDAGGKCTDCHTKIFQMKSHSFSMGAAEHGSGKYCGACHNGEKAFGQSAECGKCHKK
jgi:c(7)-type cytochrome triheme protein